MVGTYYHSLDEKGRLAIPSKFKEELGTGFVLTKSLDRCLSVYPKQEFDEFRKRLAELPKVSSEKARRLRRFIFGNSIEPEPDKQGRILIPQPLREYAMLKKEVTLVAVDTHFEIWDKETYERYSAETDENAAGDLEGITL